ncbi:hypothetical protein SAY87_011228 [Trapa incisa]|uniref:WRKY domain-containing protein n=1 Tax=Trapa incisa TaxID=236973 RepID=A0AAN7GIZ3_9MYRT|nr:hypothetical protein SAY87_011228 [Trapa incisa]
MAPLSITLAGADQRPVQAGKLGFSVKFQPLLSLPLYPFSLFPLKTQGSPPPLPHHQPLQLLAAMEQKVLISELVQGSNLAKQLRHHLSSESSPETQVVLIQSIVKSFDKALQILKWRGPINCQSQPVSTVATAGTADLTESPPASIKWSLSSDNINGGAAESEQLEGRYASKKRKILPRWTNQVKISAEMGLEGPQDDGYGWRKYGQKDILGSKYPRSYYRCTYRDTKNCWATKQVQRSDDDPTMFHILYQGKHSCAFGGPAPSPASPKELMKQTNHASHHQDQSHDAMARFHTGLRVEIDNLDGSNSFPSSPLGYLHRESYSHSSMMPNTNGDDHEGRSISSPFLSPPTTTIQSNYFSPVGFPTPMHDAQHQWRRP